MITKRLVWLAFLLVVSGACRDTPTALHRDTDSVPPPPPPPPASPCRNTTVDLSTVSFVRNPLLKCGTQLNVSLGSTPASFTTANRNTVLAAIGSAVQIWHGALGAPQVGLFQFDSARSGGIVINIESSNPTVNCGDTQPGISRIVLRASPCNGNYSSLAELENLIVHELAHVIGFDGTQWHSGASDSVRGNCASHLPSRDRATINGSVCAIELETIYYAYGIRATAPSIRRHVITGLSGLPSQLAVAPGTSTVLTVTGLRSDAPFCETDGGTVPGPQRGAGICELPPTGVTLSWAVSGSGLTLSPAGNGGTLEAGTGAAPGNVTVTISAPGPHQVATFFQEGTTAVAISP